MTKPTIATGDQPPAVTHNEWFVNVNWARKSTTESVTSSLTLQDDNELAVPVVANAIYIVQAMIWYDGASGSADLKMLFRTPTSGSFTGATTVVATSAGTAFDLANITVPGNGSFDCGTLGSGTQSFTVNGQLITAGTAGTLQIEWAQNTSNATATRVLAGSWLNLRRVS